MNHRAKVEKKRYMLRMVMIGVLIFSLGLAVFPQGNTGANQRNYMLIFDIKEYSAQMKEAVDFFFNNVFQKGDQLIVITPVKFIGFSREKLAVPKNQLINNILEILKTDISTGTLRYRTILSEMNQDLQSLVTSLFVTTHMDVILNNYKKNRENLAALRGNYETRLIEYSKIFRRVKGDNHLVMFLEKEYRPVPDHESMEAIRDTLNRHGDSTNKANETFFAESYELEIDLQKINAAFKYAKVRFHFMYLTGKSFPPRQGIEYADNSQEVYDIFSKIAKATDGIKLTTSRPSSFMKNLDLLVEGKVTVEVINQKMKEEKDR